MKHCTHCGTLFTTGNTWPKTCPGCAKMTWRNPTPVAVLLVPCADGLIGIRRQNTSQNGKVCLPGGFITLGETWQQAAARETFEEATLAVDAASVQLYDVVSAPDGTVLIFGLTMSFANIAFTDLPPFAPNHEASERVLIKRGDPLAFPLHEMIAGRYLNKVYRKKQREERADKRFLEELYGEGSVNCGEEGTT